VRARLGGSHAAHQPIQQDRALFPRACGSADDAGRASDRARRRHAQLRGVVDARRVDPVRDPADHGAPVPGRDPRAGGVWHQRAAKHPAAPRVVGVQSSEARAPGTRDLVLAAHLALLAMDSLVVRPHGVDARAAAARDPDDRHDRHHADRRLVRAQLDSERAGHSVSGLRVQETNGRVRLSVRVQPRAARSEIAGVHDDALKVRLTSPPVEGAANDALVKFLAETFAVARRAVRILAGEHSRSKIVEIEGITARAVHNIVEHAAH